MKPRIWIVLLESDGAAKHQITSALNSLDAGIGRISAASSFQEGVRFIQPGEPNIVFLEVNDIEQGARETAFLVSQYPQVTVIITATEKNPDWILKLIRAGASEYLTKPIVADELKEALVNVARLHLQASGPVLR